MTVTTDTGNGTSGPGRVLITGGSSGLGAALAHAVADAGGTPIVFDLEPPSLVSAVFYRVDVADRQAVEQGVAAAVDKLGGLDAVVTAAGTDACGRLDEIPADRWENVINVNLLGTVRVVRAALPHLQKSHGHVVTVASTLALSAVSDATAYCASKFGVLGFSRSLIAETRGEIGVTTLIPGGMDTHFFDGRTEQYRPADNSTLNDPANVARAVLFALDQPAGCAVRELVICHEQEESWP